MTHCLESWIGGWRLLSIESKIAPLFAMIGIDEIALTKDHHNFVAVMTALDDKGLQVGDLAGLYESHGASMTAGIVCPMASRHHDGLYRY